MAKKVLFTGGTGFLGKNFQEHIRDYNTKDIEFVFTGRSDVDLMDRDATIKFFDHHKFDMVVHAAAYCGGIDENMRNPATMFSRNMEMGMNVIHASSIHGVENFILLGSVCSYPAVPKTIPFVESEIWDGYPEPTNAPYGISKRNLMMLLDIHCRTGKMRGITLIPSNMYGKYDTRGERSHVIPAIFDKMIAAKKSGVEYVELFGSGKATRDFVHVSVVCEALYLIMMQELDMRFYLGIQIPKVMNIGSGKEYSIFEVARLIARIVGYTGKILFNPEYPDGQIRRVVDTSYMKNIQMLNNFGPHMETGLTEYYNYLKQVDNSI